MAVTPAPRACDACGSRYQPVRATSRYCGDRCRKRAQRAQLATPRRRPDDDVPAAPARGRAPALGPIEAALLEELRAVDRHGTTLGQQALYLARRLDNALTEGGSSVSALNRELRATTAEALQAVQGAGDALDEIAAARARRLAGAGG